MIAMQRVSTAERPPLAPVEVRTEHVLYHVAATDGDVAFYVWAESTEAVVAVIFERTSKLRLPPMFRGIRVIR